MRRLVSRLLTTAFLFVVAVFAGTALGCPPAKPGDPPPAFIISDYKYTTPLNFKARLKGELTLRIVFALALELAERERVDLMRNLLGLPERRLICKHRI